MGRKEDRNKIVSHVRDLLRKCKKIRIEDFDLSDECIRQLKEAEEDYVIQSYPVYKGKDFIVVKSSLLMVNYYVLGFTPVLYSKFKIGHEFKSWKYYRARFNRFFYNKKGVMGTCSKL